MNNSYYFNWNLALPLIIMFIATAVSLWRNLGMTISQLWVDTNTSEVVLNFKGLGLGWIWSSYNLLLLGVTLLILLDAPKPDIYEWFNLRRVVNLSVGDEKLWGVTTMISEVGAEIAMTRNLPENLFVGQPVSLEIAEENLQLSGEFVNFGFEDEFPTVRIKFESVSLSQHRQLVEMLFCRPGQWKRNVTPGELRSLLLLFKIILKPRVLFDRKVDVSAVKVAQG